MIDDEMCELCGENMGLPYDPETDEAYCASCKMVLMTCISLEDFLMETDPETLANQVQKAVLRGAFHDDGLCYYSGCRHYALPRLRMSCLSRRSVIKLCTIHAVEECLPHLEDAE